MSNVDLNKTFDKILKENVLSGDFKLANFKSNLKGFLTFVANTFSFLNAELNHEVIDATIASVCSKLVASQFTKLKNPQSSRAYLGAVYASRVLSMVFNTKEDIRDHLKSRYGTQLVLAADSLELGKCVITSFIGC